MTKKENAKALAELEEEYKNSEKRELLFVRGLYFALFECCKNQITIDELTSKALFEFPPINYLAANVLLTNNDKLSISELYEKAPVIFYNLVFKELNEDQKISSLFKGIKPKTKHLSLYIHKLIHKEFDSNSIDSYIYIGKKPFKKMRVKNSTI